MPATNYTPILLYRSSTASAAPTTGNLNAGELAINYNDGKLYYKDNAGTPAIQLIGARLGTNTTTGATVATALGSELNKTGGLVSQSGTLTASALLLGGGSGTAISSTTTAANIVTWIGTPSSANLAAAMTDETGSGLLVFGTTPVITALREKSAAISASDIDLAAANYFTKTISGTTTFTVSNVATSGDVSAFILILTNGGSATVNWFSGVTWNNATPPTLTASGVDILGFFTINGGTTWRGLVLAKAVA